MCVAAEGGGAEGDGTVTVGVFVTAGWRWIWDWGRNLESVAIWGLNLGSQFGVSSGLKGRAEVRAELESGMGVDDWARSGIRREIRARNGDGNGGGNEVVVAFCSRQRSGSGGRSGESESSGPTLITLVITH